MPELTLESLAARLTEVERELAALKAKPPAVIPATRDWRSVVGISEETEFSRAMQAEYGGRTGGRRMVLRSCRTHGRRLSE
jgi:hypothetical protein